MTSNPVSRTPESEIRNPGVDLSLPITAHRAEIIEAIKQHPVVVVAGETGSGKTTQLPQFCLEAGRGQDARIGCTQPRRIAARAVAERVAEELNQPLGQMVGYQVRFTDRTAASTRLKFMTDGILLAETQGDPLLKAYDTLILDEAHERSLNIDFLLGYLKRLLEKRDDLKLVITSATIDTSRFARHFNEAPVIEVSGRGYPVEVRYRPLSEQGEGLNPAIAAALDELDRGTTRGDSLVFLSGEREIREASNFLRKQQTKVREVLPLYGRLGAQAQHRIFHPGKQQRVVLATNVAETSLTVPRIHSVVDAGTARISRYSPRSKIQRLPIEPVAQASAAQRAGRCGRLAPGVCIRLYSQQDFESRPQYTEPEILRTNLASVILRMSALKLGAVEDFPFLDKPSSQQINDGYQLLIELGALGSDRELTALGRDLARLPVDPQIGRMILGADEWHCLQDVLIVASSLSIQDPRERPMEAQQQADEAHAIFADKRSDFLSLLKLWRSFEKQREDLGSNALKRWCSRHFVSHRRMREWREVHHQLKILARGIGLKGSDKSDYDDLHRALLTGLIGQVGHLDEDKQFEAPRQRRFMLHPASGLATKPPKWVMTAELVETSRVFARVNAHIKPEWVEQAASHLVKRHYFEPWYEKSTTRVCAWEQVSLFGLNLVERRRVHYGPINVRESRELFIRHALARFEYDTDAPYMEHNRALVAQIEALEHKQRRHDVLAHENALVQFFQERLPADIVTGKQFERWRREAERDNAKILFLDRQELMRHQAVDVTAERFPEALKLDGIDYELAYQFEPGSDVDGVTIRVPIDQLAGLDARRLDWLVPGLIREKLEALLKSLPKALRRHFVPIPDFVQALLEAMPYGEGNLCERTAVELARMGGVKITPQALQEVALPLHLYMNISVLDSAGAVLAQGRRLSELQSHLQEAGRKAFTAKTGTQWHLDDQRSWAFGEILRRVSLDDGQFGYPALVDQRDAVGLRLFQTGEEADVAMRAGLKRLLKLAIPDKLKYLRRNPVIDAQTCLSYASLDTCDALKSDVLEALLKEQIAGAAEDIRNPKAFESLVLRARGEMLQRADALGSLIRDVLRGYFECARRLDVEMQERWPQTAEEIADQLAWLVWPGFVAEVMPARLRQYPRYLTAVNRRLDSLPRDPKADARKLQQIEPYWREYQALVEIHGWPGTEKMEQLRWMIEEYRVSVFAQKLGTGEPVSPKRLNQALSLARVALGNSD